MLVSPSSGQDDRRYFFVEVEALAPDTTKIALGTWSGLAIDESDAARQASARCWDSRWKSAPLTAVREERRYLTSEGWGHFFISNSEVETRWVIDRSSQNLIDAQLKGTNGAWLELDGAQAADLANSLRDNDVLEDAGEDIGAVRVSSLPLWASHRLGINTVPPHSPYPSMSPQWTPATRSAPNSADAGLNPSPQIQRDVLANAIGEAAVQAGIIDGCSSLTGPQLLLLLKDLTRLATQPQTQSVAVVVRGGVVQGVSSDGPLEVFVVDYDVDGCDEDQMTYLDGLANIAKPSADVDAARMERVAAAFNSKPSPVPGEVPAGN